MVEFISKRRPDLSHGLEHSSSLKSFIHNRSSEDMVETSPQSVDLIIAGPPYNIGTVYGENTDRLPFAEYTSMLASVLRNCHRVLKDEGTIVIEAADTVSSEGKYLQLAGLIQGMCMQNGLYLSERHLNFANSNNGIELPEDNRWDESYTAAGDAHSNLHHWLVFKKKQTLFNGGEIFYINYNETEEHPCPFPDQTIGLFLDRYFSKGMKVLDPFMGTGKLGAKVIEKGGSFIGYEIDPKIFQVAKKN